MEGSGKYCYHIQSKSVTNPFCFRYSMPRFGFMLNLKWGESSRLWSGAPCYDLLVDSSTLSGLLVDADLKFHFPLLLLLKAAQSRCDLPRTTSEDFRSVLKKIASEHIRILNRLTRHPPLNVKTVPALPGLFQLQTLQHHLHHPETSKSFKCPWMPCSYHTPTVLSTSENSQSHLYIAFASWRVFLCGLAQDCHWLLILESTRASGLCCPVDILLYLGQSSVILLALCFFHLICWWRISSKVIWSPEVRHWDSHPIDNGSHECHLNQGWVPEIETSWNIQALWNDVASFERSAKDCRASCFNSCSSRYIKLQTACLKCLNC